MPLELARQRNLLRRKLRANPYGAQSVSEGLSRPGTVRGYLDDDRLHECQSYW